LTSPHSHGVQKTQLSKDLFDAKIEAERH